MTISLRVDNFLNLSKLTLERHRERLRDNQSETVLHLHFHSTLTLSAKHQGNGETYFKTYREEHGLLLIQTCVNHRCTSQTRGYHLRIQQIRVLRRQIITCMLIQTITLFLVHGLNVRVRLMDPTEQLPCTSTVKNKVKKQLVSR